jgi:hypothetical protein
MKYFLLGALMVYLLQAAIRSQISQSGLEITSPSGMLKLALLDPVAAWSARNLQAK